MRQILGVWGQSPRKHVLPPHTAFLSRAPSHNACIGDDALFDEQLASTVKVSIEDPICLIPR